MKEVYYRIISSPARLWTFVGLMIAEFSAFGFLVYSWIRDSKKRDEEKGDDE